MVYRLVSTSRAFLTITPDIIFNYPIWQITETYAFLPREAVTQFLLCCTDCQKRLTEDRKHSPTSSCDSNQPLPVDLLDFHSQSHFDQTPTMPRSPSTSTIACPCASPPSSHLRDNNNDSNLQPFDYSSHLSPVSLATDTIRKQRKRKVTRKVIRLGDECQNDEVLDYSSNKSTFDSCGGNYRSPSAEPAMEATEQVILYSWNSRYELEFISELAYEYIIVIFINQLKNILGIEKTLIFGWLLITILTLRSTF